MQTLNYNASDEHDTQQLGQALAAVLEPGSVVALVGPLGAGKTRLVQAVARGLSVPNDIVTSPTFVLVNEYRQGRLPIFHFDAYRLTDIDEFAELGPEEYFEADGVCLVEWADRVDVLLPPEHLRIEIDVVGETARRFTVVGNSPPAEALVQQLAAKLGGS